MRVIPNPPSLKAAVGEVVRQNQAMGYNPTRFIRSTTVDAERELVMVCDNLVRSDSAFEAIWNAVTGDYPELLTLEDLIVHSRHGKSWGLTESTITEAKFRVECLDKVTGHQRWASRTA